MALLRESDSEIYPWGSGMVNCNHNMIKYLLYQKFGAWGSVKF